jgi:osmotically-inducible protein OsmY
MHGLRLSLALWFLLFLAFSGCLRVTGPTSPEDRGDGAISKEVEAKLAGHHFGGLSDIVVTSEAGVVTLAGKVEKAEQKARAADLARQVKGVKRVKNDLDIRPTRPE